MALQDQVLSMRVYQVKIMKLGVPALTCRLCSRHEETIQHLLAGCPVLAPSSYMNRHSMVAQALHCYSAVAKSWNSHESLPVVEDANVKILWDFGIQTLAAIGSNRPDL